MERKMMQTWGSSDWGKVFTKTPEWRLTVGEEDVVLEVSGRPLPLSMQELESLRITQGIFWSSVEISIRGRAPILLDGIPNTAAATMGMAIFKLREADKKKQEIARLVATFSASIRPIVEWYQDAVIAIKTQLRRTGWLTHQFIVKWSTLKPTSQIDSLLISTELQQHLASQPAAVQSALKMWQRDFETAASAINSHHVTVELKNSKTFFDTVEKSPLTEEQARSVICFDNLILVIAAAGSGKTSTMVAKAGYALMKGYASPEEILLLAFNHDAADELQERVRTRLKPIGLDANGIVARTFHKFGLDVIGDVTGRRPTLAPWVENGGDIRMLSEIIDSLKDTDKLFRLEWDLFRIVLSRDLPAFGEERDDPEDWDKESRTAGFLTLQGEVVKSRGERLIADWLFYNGVEYQYETAYEIDTADPRHRQYRPDFYYPGIGAYHEHWALDQFGSPPASFEGYLEGVSWKRACHEKNGTTLLETTTAQLWSGKAFDHLAHELTSRGIRLDPNPDRPSQNRRQVEHKELVRTFRTFLNHAKSNQYSDSVLSSRLANEPPHSFHFRHQMFLKLFARIRAAWEAKLKRHDVIDFEDMLNRASEFIESGRWKSPFTLVMVDEFQDASRARSRMVKALVAHPDLCLFAVGDDWQSINRFAGADISSMTQFEVIFGKATTLRLERTFRCPQSICTTASTFIQRNTDQLRKVVRSTAKEYAPSVELVEVEDEDQIQAFLADRFEALATRLRDEEGPDAKKLSVFVLGRYRRDSKYVPQSGAWSRGVDVSFHTIHGSKGLEADYVVLPRVASGNQGFPSNIQDDPVLQLAMPEGDSYPHAEERRLFYVALTRARRSALVVAVAHRPSEFITELIRDHKLELVSTSGTPTVAIVCTKAGCGGRMVQRISKLGPFLGCSRFPACQEKRSMAQVGNLPPPPP